jgi:hypothetical protein
MLLLMFNISHVHVGKRPSAQETDAWEMWYQIVFFAHPVRYQSGHCIIDQIASSA